MKRTLVSFFSFLILLFAGAADAQDYNQAPPPKLSESEIQELVGPIALYPDPLLSQILPASTYPLDIVQAARMIKSKKDFSKIEGQPWDDSVKAVAHYPDVLKMMSDKLEWTQRLGQAVLAQQEDVLKVVQGLRLKAQDNGNLKSNSKQKVVQAENYIEIQPSDPDVVYVPVYDPQVVYVVPAAELYYPVISFSIGFPFWPCFTSFYWPSYSLYYNPYYWGHYPYYGYNGYYGGGHGRHGWDGNHHWNGNNNWDGNHHWDGNNNTWNGNNNSWDGNRPWNGNQNQNNTGLRTVTKPYPSGVDAPRWSHNDQRDNPFNGRRGFNPTATPATFQDKVGSGRSMPSFSDRGGNRVNTFAKPQPVSYIPRNSDNNTFQNRAGPGRSMPSFSDRGGNGVNTFAKPQPVSYIPRNSDNNTFRSNGSQKMSPSRFENAPRTTFKPREASYMPPPRQEVKTVAPTVDRAPSNNNYRSSMSENRQAPSRPSYSSPSFNRGGGFGGGGRGFGGGSGGGFRTMSKH